MARRRTGALLVAVAALLTAGCGGRSGDNGARTTTTDAAPTTTEAAAMGIPTTIDKILIGQCANDVPSREQRTVAVLSLGCELPHLYEVFAQFRYPPGAAPVPGGTPYPGETAVRTASEQACFDQFQPWMGTAWTASNYDIQTWWPSSSSWTTRGDRKVTCGAYLLSGKRTTGSVRGTGQ